MLIALGILASAVAAFLSWTLRTVTSNTWNDVLFAPVTNGNWFIFGNTGTSTTSYQYSTDTVTWSTGTTPISGSWGVAAYSGSRIMLFERNFSRTTALTSTNGTTWTSVTLPTAITAQNAIWDGSQFVVTNSGSTTAGVYYSTTGTSGWTAVNIGGSGRDISFDGSRYIASRSANSNIAFTSTTGIGGTWSSVTLPSTQLWRQVVNGGGYFVTVNSSTGDIAYSTNGTTWTALTVASTDNTWVYAGNKFWYFTRPTDLTVKYRDNPTTAESSFTVSGGSASPTAVATGSETIVLATSGADLWVGR